MTLEEVFDFLKSCHRRAPFLSYNGNTFAEIGRALTNALFADWPFVRRKEVASVVAHFITGVLDREIMVASFNSLARSAHFQAGARVKTLRGSLHGVITRVLEDGRVAVRAEGSASDLLCLPESLLPDG